ncbi:MAG: response regulator [Rhodospirillales bacterium]
MTYKVDVLLIDDEPMVRELLRDNLEALHVSVEEAGDGREGLTKIIECRPRLIVSDVRMPQLNGYQILHEVRKKHSELASTKIILLTGLTDAEYVSAAYRIGADDYMTKPINTKQFLDRVTELLNASRAEEAMEDTASNMASEPSWTDLPAEKVSLSSIAQTVGSRIGNLPFNVGQVVCIDVDDLRRRLGNERWERTSNKVTELIIGAAKRYCGPDDTYFRCPDGSVLFVFAGKDAERARSVTADISKRVNKSLFGSQMFEGVAVEDHVSAAGAGPSRKTFSPNEIVEALLPIATKMGITDKTWISQPTDSEAEQPSGAGASPVREIRKKGLELESVRGELLERFGAFGKKPVRFRYSPVWNVQRKFVGIFECAAARESGSARTLVWNHDVLDRDHELSDIVDLDVACLEHALLGVTDHLIAGTPLLVCPSMHYETLASRMGRDRVLELLNQMPGEMSDSVSLKLMFVPEGVPEIRLSEILGLVRGRVAEPSVEMSASFDPAYLSRMINRFKLGGFRNVFVRMKENPTPAEIDKAKSFAEIAKKFGLTPGVLGVDSQSLLFELAYSGFILLGGMVVGASDETLPVPYPLDSRNLEAGG